MLPVPSDDEEELAPLPQRATPAHSSAMPVPSDDDEPQAPPMKRQNTTVLETLASAYADRHGGLPAEKFFVKVRTRSKRSARARKA